MTLEDLGYTPELENHRVQEELTDFEVGRVTSEHKERYVVRTAEGEYEAELLGNLRFTAESRYDLPAVGDWVAISIYDNDKALIHRIFPRKTIIERQAAGKAGKTQIIATNVDCGIIVQAVDRDFSLNRLERYLTICHASNVTPVIVLSKIDLISEQALEEIMKQIEERMKGTLVIPLSNQTGAGREALASLFEKGKTCCLLGSSGVGKSTLTNVLSESAQMKTGEINESIDRGRHVTSHREMILLQNGGIIIDNPGMREVGITDADEGLEATFEDIIALAEDCRFKDCTHVNESGCAVLDALENEELDQEAYTNFQKMQREKIRFETTVHEQRRKDKGFGKMMKDVIKVRKHNKY